MISEASQKGIKSFLSEDACKNAGLVLMNISSDAVSLGAMNPVYSEVTNVVKRLKDQYSVEVSLEQISPDQWEKWYEEGFTITKENLLLNNPEDEKPLAKTKSLRATFSTILSDSIILDFIRILFSME